MYHLPVVIVACLYSKQLIPNRTEQRHICDEVRNEAKRQAKGGKGHIIFLRLLYDYLGAITNPW